MEQYANSVALVLFGVFVALGITLGTLYILKVILDNDKREQRRRAEQGMVLDFRVQYFLAHPLDLTLNHKQYGILVNPVVEALPMNVFKPLPDTCIATPQAFQDDPRGNKNFPELAFHADSELHLKAELFREPNTNFKQTMKYGNGYKGKRIVLPPRELNKLHKKFDKRKPDGPTRYDAENLQYAEGGRMNAKTWAMHYFRQNPSEVVVNHPRHGYLWHPRHECNLRPLFRQYLVSIASVMPADIDMSVVETESLPSYWETPPEDLENLQRSLYNEVDLDNYEFNSGATEMQSKPPQMIGKKQTTQNASYRNASGSSSPASPSSRRGALKTN